MPSVSVWDNALLDVYFQDIAQETPLSFEEEARLARKIQSGDRKARDLLVRANLRFVVHVAGEYRNCGLPLEDLISAGNLGLLVAAERFDETRGFKFITYAHWWIRQSIFNAVADEKYLVRLPANRIKLLRNMSRLIRQFSHSGLAQPSPESISLALGVPQDMVEDTLLGAQAAQSLDASPEEENAAPLEALHDVAQALPDEQICASSDLRLLRRVLNSLEAREARILRLHFGLEDRQPRSLTSIGKQLGISKERVRQIKENALEKLRHPRRRACLELLRNAN